MTMMTTHRQMTQMMIQMTQLEQGQINLQIKSLVLVNQTPRLVHGPTLLPLTSLVISQQIPPTKPWESQTAQPFPKIRLKTRLSAHEKVLKILGLFAAAAGIAIILGSWLVLTMFLRRRKNKPHKKHHSKHEEPKPEPVVRHGEPVAPPPPPQSPSPSPNPNHNQNLYNMRSTYLNILPCPSL